MNREVIIRGEKNEPARVAEVGAGRVNVGNDSEAPSFAHSKAHPASFLSRPIPGIS